MKIGFYSPYLDSFGGGERYILTLASHWSHSHDVHIFWDDPMILTTSEKRFCIPLGKIKREPNVFRYQVLKKISATQSYDLLFVLSDGSVPIHGAKKGILHFQVPFGHVKFPFWKHFIYQSIVCNSEFTKHNLDERIAIPRIVIYPPVRVGVTPKGIKTNTILSVGRFNGHYDAKKQGVLIKAFGEGVKSGVLRGWNLVFVGSKLPSDGPFVERLKESAKGLSISFYPNCGYEELQTWYGKSRIYWHAAGFGEYNPEHMEHFGMSTVEAMAAGSIPIVFAGGGQTEIVTDGADGYVWSTTAELLDKTAKVLEGNDVMGERARKRAGDFSENRFVRAFDQLVLTL